MVNCLRPHRYGLEFLYLFLFLFLLSIDLSGTAWAEENMAAPDKTFTLYWENDTFLGTDRDYTNGLKLTWSRAVGDDENRSGFLDGLIDYLPFVNDEDVIQTLSYSFGQFLFTPEETQRTDLVEDDRPYAGYSYYGLGFHARKGIRRNILEFNLGVVGPLSMGQEVQDVIHDRIDSPKARGWDHQLDNEPALDIIIESKWRLIQKDINPSFGYDVIPHVGGNIGNVAVYANTGAEFRLGWFIPKDFGSCPIRPGCDLTGATAKLTDGGRRTPGYGFHLFVSVDGRFVLHNIFLDGNTFSDSHSVEKEHLVADLMVGLVFSLKRFKVSYAYVFRTKEFKEQDDPQIFGAVNVSYSF